jgi:hypothetical protein
MDDYEKGYWKDCNDVHSILDQMYFIFDTLKKEKLGFLETSFFELAEYSFTKEQTINSIKQRIQGNQIYG